MADAAKQPAAQAWSAGTLGTVQQAAAFLQVTPRALASLVRAGAVPCLRFGSGARRIVRFDQDALRRWGAAQAAKAI